MYNRSIDCKAGWRQYLKLHLKKKSYYIGSLASSCYNASIHFWYLLLPELSVTKFSWSPSQLSESECRVSLWTSCWFVTGTQRHKQPFAFTYTNVFGLWLEAEEPRENPSRQPRDSTQTSINMFIWSFVCCVALMERLVGELGSLLKLLDQETLSPATADKMASVRNILDSLPGR